MDSTDPYDPDNCWFAQQSPLVAWSVAIPLLLLGLIRTVTITVFSSPIRFLSWIRKGGFWQWVILLFTLYGLIGGGLNTLRIHYQDLQASAHESSLLKQEIISMKDEVAYARYVKAELATGSVLIKNDILNTVLNEDGTISEEVSLAAYHDHNSRILFAELVSGIRKEVGAKVSDKVAIANMYRYICFKQIAEAYNCSGGADNKWHVKSHSDARSSIQMKTAAASESAAHIRIRYSDFPYNLTADLSEIKRIEENGEAIYGINRMYQYSLAVSYLKSWSDIHDNMKLTRAQKKERRYVASLILKILEGDMSKKTYIETYKRHFRGTLGPSEYKNIDRAYRALTSATNGSV